ncbi:four helix bundle protein [Candidatus Margulisiibacteriota bacterium]
MKGNERRKVFMKHEFQSLPVYIKAKEFYQALKKDVLTKVTDRYVKDQLARASLSIVLNIAEGYGRFHKADKKNFYINARASVNECVACLDIVFDSEIPEEHLEMASELGKMISGLVKKFS